MRRPVVDLTDFWKGVPLAGRAIFFLAVFSTFSILGFVVDLMGGARTEPRGLAILAVYCGLFAVAIGWSAIRRNWWALTGTIAIGLIVSRWMRDFVDTAVETGAPSEQRLALLAIGIAAAASLGYTFFVSFISIEGKRYLRVHGELAIAAEVHRTIVPERSFRAEGWEWWGRSDPSGEVGGDLFDVVASPGGRAGYVIDVAGHGIGAGVLMAMAKSGARAHLSRERSGGALLSRLNVTLEGLLEPNRFATAACAIARADGTLDLALAGHVPALVVRKDRGEVETHASTDPPLGIFPEHEFGSRAISLDPGDTLVVLTDGFTEVADRTGAEFGLERIAEILSRKAGSPLSEIFRAVREASQGHGPQTDDQTLLLVRRLESEADGGVQRHGGRGVQGTGA